MSSEDINKLYQKRLARCQAAIQLKEPDRVPISAGSNYFAEIYSGISKQDFLYNPEKWLEADRIFVLDFPEVDSHRSGRFWAPHLDTVGWNMYKIPGRDLRVEVPFQFEEGERMKADEYDFLIKSPAEFIFERVLPRVFDEFHQVGSMRSYMAFLKNGMTYMQSSIHMKRKSEHLEHHLGMPLSMGGSVLAPFDYLADGLRGLTGIMEDIFRRPEKIEEACEAIIPHIVNAVLAIADPQRRYPIHMPLHRGCTPFLSPKQFDTFYWPSLKKVMLMLISAGYTIRPYLEGNWESNWYHFLEIPAGNLILDVDNPADIFKAKKELGTQHCIAGGMPDSTLILGNPSDVRDKVRELCEKLAPGGGYIINGGCGIPYDTKPENYRAMIDGVLEFGRYKDDIDFIPKIGEQPLQDWDPPTKSFVTHWKEKKESLDLIPGDEEMIQDEWEKLEHMAFNWLWSWLW